MKVITKRPFSLNRTVVCIGKFDGLHRGHQVLINSLENEAEIDKVLFTFPLPGEKNIYTEDEKRFLAEKIGVDTYVECPFDESFRSMSPEQFVSDILVNECHAMAICVGDDFRFGKDRAGDKLLLQALSIKYGYSVKIVRKETYNEEEISSTRIRKCIAEGDICAANDMLGTPLFIMGKIEHGNQIGRTIGFPTTNVILDQTKLAPKFGVYLTENHVAGGTYRGITNIGVKPTIAKDNVVSAETFLKDFSGDIYGETIRTELIEFVRPEMKFGSIDELKKQINIDCQRL
ncbi:riboflavin biosynthesis protein RibF [Eubacterium xylanophilum]|uniref:riboflavin biosynthesis protein RibF n=1 Tax=Eubacterium xylanophilum TaxID=39497 RepID=UPI0004BA348A|nr:riboflavin biosynthesis protein RibF [Eubacterium xylanophilum]